MKIQPMFFSPTGTTKKLVESLALSIFENSKRYTNDIVLLENIDFTLIQSRKINEDYICLSEDNILILGIPVYAGRVPNILLNFLDMIKGNNTPCIAIVMYGNRNYDDALIEIKTILSENGFNVIGGGAFIGEHSFSYSLAKGRPDSEDLALANQFGISISEKIFAKKDLTPINVPGNFPLRNYYKPINHQGIAVDIRKVKPKTNSSCNSCKTCVSICPMGSIDFEDVSLLNGICIKCGACIKGCPLNAKYFDDADFLRHKEELEVDFAVRRNPEMYI